MIDRGTMKSKILAVNGLAAAASLYLVLTSEECRRARARRAIKVAVDAEEILKLLPKGHLFFSPPTVGRNDELVSKIVQGEANSRYGSHVPLTLCHIDNSLGEFVSGYQHNANAPCEDRLVAKRVAMTDGKDVVVSVVLDGHGGGDIADYAHRHIVSYVETEIKGLKSSQTSDIAKALPLALGKIDHDMMGMVRSRKNMLLSRTAKCGACCLATVVTPSHVVVANAGDCEGTINQGRNFLRLAEPHSMNEPSEQIRCRKAYPDDPGIFRCKQTKRREKIPTRWYHYVMKRFNFLGGEVYPTTCYIKGRLQPTRCLGDWHLKSKEFAYDIESQRALVQPPYQFPYITAIPDVFTIRHSWRNKRMVVATDGVYDFLSHNDVHALLKKKDLSARDLVDSTLKAAAVNAGMSYEELNKLKGGRPRRSVHDDTSAMVVDLPAMRRALWPTTTSRLLDRFLK